jgi:hypothetical protein
MTTPSQRSSSHSTLQTSSIGRPRLIAAALALAAVTAASSARSAPVWVGDFETGDLSQWSGELNGEHITVVQSPVLQGSYAAQIQLTNDALWSNGLKRVELNHSPAAGRTAEGAELYFAWSFYLPETLPQDPSQTIGYWESDKSYQQVMAFHLEGEKIRFITQKPQYAVHWEADGKVTTATWHRLAMRVKWSKDPGQGSVDVWFDGEMVVTNASAQTLADDNSHFTQLGLLRGKVEFQDMPIIVVDDAVEGNTLEDVHPALPEPGSGGAGGGGGGAGGNGVGGGGVAGGGAGGSSQGGSSGEGGGGAAEPTDEGSCDCRQAISSSNRSGSGILALIAALAFAGARRSARNRNR